VRNVSPSSHPPRRARAARRPAAAPLQFRLNGQPVDLEAGRPDTTLLAFLRARGLTAAKDGCSEGECGACAVAMVVPDGAGSRYQAVNSCLLFAPMAAQQEIYTAESLAAGGALADVQRAIVDADASQCGFCMPGMAMSLFAEHHRPGRREPCDPAALAGNLCRCGGYRALRQAVATLGPPADGCFRRRMAQPAPAIGGARSAGFSRPTTVDECTALLAADPDATVVAGGTDLVVEAVQGRCRVGHLVSVEAIPELRAVVTTTDSVRIGAGVPLSEMARRWTAAPPVLHEWLDRFGSPLVRNRATLGGNLVTASPVGDAAPLLLALDATLHVAAAGGRRVASVESFFPGYRRAALDAGELLTAIDLPARWPRDFRFYKVTKRRQDDIASVAAALAIDVDGAGRVTHARFAFGGLAATPIRLLEAERAVVGQAWDARAIELVQNTLARTCDPISDQRGSRDYRLRVASRLLDRFWSERR
jgi:xanthine dehydrogenase small subunit